MKAKSTMAAGAAILASILVFGFYGLGQSLASGGYKGGDHDLDHEHEGRYGNNLRQVSTIDPVYAEECGSCHLAYPAGLLPGRSWRELMRGLDDHFGENAELDEMTRRDIEDYLARESARAPISKLFRNLGGAAPLRITELPYFVREHDEIPARYVAGNEQVKLLSRCNACHRGAQRGRFDEDDVVIPGFGRWDD